MHRPRFALCALLFVFAACGTTTTGGGDDATAPDAGLTPPDGPPAGGCTAGTACDLDGTPGVCTADACGTCDSDAACQSAYGGSYACVGGACVIPPPPGGCTDSSQCDVGQTCNAQGMCVAAGGACAGHSQGDACGSGDLCCTRSGSLSCVEVECCTAADCPSGSNDSCQAGVCVPPTSTCATPSTATYYVDPSYSGPSTGTAACPFKTLHGAFNAVRNDAFTGDSEVRIVGGAVINATSEGGADKFPLSVPSSVYVHTVVNGTPAIIVAPANTTAFEIQYAAQSGATYAARLSQLEIKQASAATGGTAVHTIAGSSATPVHLDHLEIHNFYDGINVGGGYAAIDWGVDAHDNASAGLYVGGGRAAITVGASADARTHFDKNKYGIYVTSDTGSAITVDGALTSDNFETVTASNNSSTGIHLASSASVNSLSHVGAIGNGGSGVGLFGGGAGKLRDLNIQNNLLDGIHIVDNGGATSLSGFDLGKAGDFGHNVLVGNAHTNVCISTTYDGSVLSAEGNTSNQADCSVAAPTINVRYYNDCSTHAGGIGDNGSTTFRTDFHNCTLVWGQ